MYYILDIIAAAVVVICVVSGSKKGAVRMIISAVGCVAAAAAAVFVSGAADEYVYDRFVRPSVLSALEKKADEFVEDHFSEEKFGEFLSENGIEIDGDRLSSIAENAGEYMEVLTDGEFHDKLNNIFTGYCQAITEVFAGIVPEDVLAGAGSYINELETENDRKFEMLTSDKRSAAELIEREIIRPVVMKTVRTVLFLITFAAVSAVFALISYAFRAVRGISAVRSADNTLGGILGLFQGIIMTAAICVASYIFIGLTSDGNSYLNTGIISKTLAFKWVYSGTLFLLSLILN